MGMEPGNGRGYITVSIMSESPYVALMVLNWNGRSLLEKCVPSLLQLDYDHYQLFVIDNGSEDGSIDFLESQFPQANIIALTQNKGFSGAYNEAIKLIDADYVAILNNDIVVPPDWLTKLVKPLVTDKSMGVAGCKLLYPDGEHIQHAGAKLTYPLAYSEHYFYKQKDEGQANTFTDVEYVTGAAMLVSRSVLDAIGLFDDLFSPIYYEEVDFCYRVREAGFRVVYVPQATAIHHESYTMAQRHEWQNQTFNLNRLRFILKHYSCAQFLEDFIPAEIERLQSIETAVIVQNMKNVYNDFIQELPKLLPRCHKESCREMIVEQLLRLRLTAINTYESIETKVEGSYSDLIVQNKLHPPSFHSETPLIGPLLARFRQSWNDVSTTWYVQPIVDQQTQVNTWITRELVNHYEADKMLRQATTQDIQMLLKAVYQLQTQVDMLSHDVMELRKLLAAQDKQTTESPFEHDSQQNTD
ncbi:MAG: hypothetical protein CSA11_03860 [Chloroflexi bacterium]|nr:MAG: hypothetical protein CSA11_03860 [Chloroflexota bacterium]